MSRQDWPEFPGHIGKISRPDCLWFLGQISPNFPGQICPDFPGHIDPQLQARLAQISRPDWPEFPGQISRPDWICPDFHARLHKFQTKLASISRQDCLVITVHIGPDFQPKIAQMYRADWFGYPGVVFGVTPDKLDMDYVKQVSTYRILNDMKSASLLQKLRWFCCQGSYLEKAV